MLESLEAALYPIVVNINTYLSSYILVFLLIGVGLFYSIRTRFVQVRCFGEGMRKVFGNLTLRGGKQEHGMSSFQALATAIAAQVGTGNIVGGSGAILAGGPGAIFWMWVIAFFGMATIYAEATLAIETRQKDPDGSYRGGPVYYITTAFKGGFGKFLAGFFAVAIILALGFMGCMVQSNSIGSTFQTAFGVPSWIVGIVLVVICGFIFVGGVQRLASVTEKIVPVMAAIFLGGALVVLVMRAKYIPDTIAMIFQYAFQPQAIIGGGFGYALKEAISQGAKRGLFSNEAGMGSTPHAHAQANVTDPHDQAVVAMVSVFIDTFVVLTLNALVVISTLYTEGGPLANRDAEQDQSGPDCLRCGLWGGGWSHVCGGLPVLLRLLHRAQLEPVRQDQRGLSVWKKGGPCLLRHCPGLHFPGYCDVQRSGVGADRYVQQPDGHPQRHRPVCPVQHCGTGGRPEEGGRKEGVTGPGVLTGKRPPAPGSSLSKMLKLRSAP